MSIIISLLTVVLMIVCLLIVVIVLMQRPRQEGLGAAFGGGMTDQMFGAQTTNVLQKGTVYLAVAFFGISLLLAILMAKEQGKTTTVPAELTESDPVPVQEAPSTGLTIDTPPLVPGESGMGVPGAADLTIETPSLVPGEPGTEGETTMPAIDGGESSEGDKALDAEKPKEAAKEPNGAGQKKEDAGAGVSADTPDKAAAKKAKKPKQDAEAPAEAEGAATEPAAEGEATN